MIRKQTYAFAGVITYSSNLNTANVIRQLAAQGTDKSLRIVLETDAPFMTPSNVYGSLKDMKGKLPLSHSAMIPWTADFVAGVANEVAGAGAWDADRVLRESRENARTMYRV